MIGLVTTYVVPAALSLLPPEMNTPAARAAVLAIGLQESKLLARRQLPRGPARGLWQFEKGGGLKGVLTHRLTRGLALDVLRQLRYLTNGDTLTLSARLNVVHPILEHNDVLACAFARLLLWTVPARLPTRHQPNAGWAQYLEGWQPGKPRRETWDVNFLEAWNYVDGTVGDP